MWAPTSLNIHLASVGCRDPFFFFPEITLRCSALICSVLSSTWEADLAVKANSPKDTVWSETPAFCHYVPHWAVWLHLQPDCLHNFSYFFHIEYFGCWGVSWFIFIDMKGGSLPGSIFTGALDASGLKESMETQTAILLSLILFVSLLSLWHSEAEPDLHSACPPNCLIWENRAIRSLFPATPPLMPQTGVCGAKSGIYRTILSASILSIRLTVLFKIQFLGAWLVTIISYFSN